MLGKTHQNANGSAVLPPADLFCIRIYLQGLKQGRITRSWGTVFLDSTTTLWVIKSELLAPCCGGKLRLAVGSAPSLSSGYEFSDVGLLASCKVVSLETCLLLLCGFLIVLLAEAEYPWTAIPACVRLHRGSIHVKFKVWNVLKHNLYWSKLQH